jgi:hypothetical protein
MAIVFDAPATPDDITLMIQEKPTPPGLGLLASFPRGESDDNTVDWGEITATNRTARFRSFDGRIHVSARDTASDKRVPLPPLSSSLNMGEYERLQVQFARTGGTRSEALERAIYNDADRLTREVQNRLELAWGDVLTDGKLTMMTTAGEPNLGEADFGVPATQLVSADTVWTDTANADVLTELVAWYDVWKVNGDGGEWLTSQRVLRLMQRNAEVINAVHGSAAGRTRVTLTELNDLLASEGLPTMAATYDGQLDVDGVTTRVIADDKLILLPVNRAELGETVYGVTATALELVDSNLSDLSFENAPGIVGVVEKVGPPYRQFTFVDAVAMPILKDAKRLLVADVAA